jgi:CRP-like cAMP-binding protein
MQRDEEDDDVEMYGSGEVVFTRGERGSHLYIVESGAVDLRIAGQVVDTASTGGIFGEMALLDHAPRSALAMASEPTRLRRVDAVAFERRVAADPAEAWRVLGVMVKRLRRTNDAMVATMDPPSPPRAPVLTPEAAEVVGSSAREFPPGAVIFQRGDPGDRMYVVRSGEVRILLGRRLVDTVSPGGFFGEMALVDGEVRSASAEAGTRCRVASLGHSDVEFLFKKTPAFALEMMRVIAQRLRRMNREMMAAKDDDA